MSGSTLERIVAETQASLEGRRRRTPLSVLRERAGERRAVRDFVGALRGSEGVGVVAEIKRGSPSKGLFAPELDASELARTYWAIGVSAVSVLTSPAFFASDDDLCAAAAALAEGDLPLLRKDFHVDGYQVAEAAALGADAYLLIAKTLELSALVDLVAAGGEWGLTAFVEITDEAELEMALSAGAAAIGINNRDLHTFEEDLGTTERLRPLVSSGAPVVAASGVRTRADMCRMESAGVDAVLIGEALSTASDAGAKLRELRGVVS